MKYRRMGEGMGIVRWMVDGLRSARVYLINLWPGCEGGDNRGCCLVVGVSILACTFFVDRGTAGAACLMLNEFKRHLVAR